jgi:quinol monooxygenase YgiN
VEAELDHVDEGIPLGHLPARSNDVAFKEVNMVTVALFVQLQAKPAKEAEIEKFLTDGLAIVEGEPATTAWFALRLGPSTFGIFDAFPNEEGRQAHLSGRVAAALMSKETAELLAKPPTIEKIDVVAAKLPGGAAQR